MATVIGWLEAAADADADDDDVAGAELAGAELDDDELETEQPATRAAATGSAARVVSRGHRLDDRAVMILDISFSLERD